MNDRRRTRQTTDEFLSKVLEDAERERWDKSGGNKQKQMEKRGRQLSSLYGTNSQSNLVKRRASKMITAGVLPGGGGPAGAISSAHSRRHSKLTPGAFGGRVGGGGGMDILGDLDAIVEGGGGDGGSGPLPNRRKSIVERAQDYVDKRGVQAFGKPPPGPAGPGPLSSSSSSSSAFGGTKTGPPGAAGAAGGEPRGSERKQSVHTHQEAPPWYVGYQNSPASPPASSHFSRVARYGLAGTLNLARLHRPHVGKGGPGFLHKANLCDPYSETLRGSPAQWPSSSEYVTGSMLDPPQAPVEVPDRLRRQAAKEEEELRRLEMSLRESRKEALNESRVRRARLRQSASADGALVAMGAGGSTPGGRTTPSSGRGPPPLSTGRASNVSTGDAHRLRYWSSLTVIYGERDEASARQGMLEKQREQRRLRLEMKWREVLYMHKIMKMPAYRKPGLEDLLDLKEHFLTESLNEQQHQMELAERHREREQRHRHHHGHGHGKKGHGHHHHHHHHQSSHHLGMDATETVIINRDQFCKSILFFFDAADPKRINRLFTAFDLERQDRMDFRAFLCTMRTLRRANESPYAKVQAFFEIFDYLGEQSLSHDDTLDLFCCLAKTDEEREEIHHLFEMRLGLNTVPQFGLERKRIPWATLEREMDDPESPLLAAFGAQLIARLADCGFQGDKPS